jgi:uncharacterized membrane protein YhiD involved in acid resistance
MLSIVMMFLQGTIGKLLKDWRVIAAILIGIVLFIVFMKFTNMEKNLKKAKEDFANEQQHSQVLQNNWNQAVEVNKQNQAVIQQLQLDKDNAQEALTSLSVSVEHANTQVSNIKSKLDSIAVKPTTISPYISEAITGVQALRDELAASAP